MLKTLDTLVPILLAIALASERLIAILKTIIPPLAEQQTTPAGEVDLKQDKGRRLTLQLLAIVTSYVSVGLAFNTWSPLSTPIADIPVSVLALTLLGSGGSAFWSSVMGYVKAVKDIKTTQRADTILKYRLNAQQSGVSALGTGEVANKAGVRPAELQVPSMAFST